MLLHAMAAVVDHRVEGSSFFDQLAEKASVGLVTNANVDALGRVPGTRGLNVNAPDAAVGK
jgi:hypothetical protein